MGKIWLACFTLLTSSVCLAQLPNETERLMSAGRLWVTVEYFHPYLANRDIDWEQALVKAIPKIRSANNREEYVAALSAMLDELHDPETLVLKAGQTLPSEHQSSPQLSLLNTAKERLFVTRTGNAEFAVFDVSGATVNVRLSQPSQELSGLPLTTESAKSSPKYSDPYPPTEARILAAIKLWGTIHYFFAYKDLMDEDWDDIFPTYLPKFISANDTTAYNLVIADLLTHLTDTNSTVRSKTMDSYFGEVPVGLNIRLLDKYPIVTAVMDPSAKAVGIQPGDVVKRIGQASTTELFQRFVQYVPASTPQRSGYDTIQRVTNGPSGSEIDLTIEDSKGESRIVKLTRQSSPAAPERTTEAIAILPGNIGYLDLERVTTVEVNSAMAKLLNTKAIIFDLRSAKAQAARVISSYLTSQSDVASELVTTPIALRPDVPTPGLATQSASTFEVRTLPNPKQPHYAGKTLALIDERTLGEAEEAGLLFEAANKTDFVGAPSAGALSSVANVFLPGDIVVTYSTEDVRHANGGKIQRLGIQPNLLAPTTAKGLRAGKDEALEAALARSR